MVFYFYVCVWFCSYMQSYGAPSDSPLDHQSSATNINQSVPVKDKVGLTREHIKQANKQIKHLQELLNYSEPDKPINSPPVDDVLEIYTSPPTEAEVLLQLP